MKAINKNKTRAGRHGFLIAYGSGLSLYQSYDKDQQACADNSADDAAYKAAEVDADKAKKCTCNSASDDSEDDVYKDTVRALHDDPCKPSAYTADNDGYYQTNHYYLLSIPGFFPAHEIITKYNRYLNKKPIDKGFCCAYNILACVRRLISALFTRKRTG